MPNPVTTLFAGDLYRIGRAPDPLAWTDRSRPSGNNRFDDPADRFRALYAGERRACFVETLARFRPSLDLIARQETLHLGSRGNDLPPLGTVPQGWLATRRIARFFVAVPDPRWLDLRQPETHEMLRGALAPTLRELAYDDYAFGDAIGRDRALTQAIAAWAYDREFPGIAYASRYDPSLSCLAIFPGVAFSGIENSPIEPDDRDFLACAALFGLTIA